MNRILKTCLIGLAFYALLLWASVGLLKPRIELQLNEKLISELDEIGDICEEFSFELSGRDCSITGGVYNELDRDQIINSIRSIDGIRKIDDGLSIIPSKYHFKSIITEFLNCLLYYLWFLLLHFLYTLEHYFFFIFIVFLGFWDLFLLFHISYFFTK